MARICAALELFEHVKYENAIHADPSHSLSGHAGAKTYSAYIQSRAVELCMAQSGWQFLDVHIQVLEEACRPVLYNPHLLNDVVGS